MNTRKISWEIIIAGLAFTGIAIYLLNRDISVHPSHAGVSQQHHIPSPPPPPEPPLPSNIVIDLNDLGNLENLRRLRNLRSLENLEDLEIELKNLDSIMDNLPGPEEQKAVEQAMKQLERELQQIEKANFKVKLQNSKVYINKDYDVKESAWSEVSPGVYVFRESFEAADLESMDLSVSFGNLNIVGSDNGKAELTVRATGDISSPKDASHKLAVSKSIQPSQASFSVTPAARSGHSGGIDLETTLTLPKHVAIEAGTSGGHISANSLDGSHEFVTAGGHITLDSVAGTTVAKTSGGHITGDELSGDVTLSTSGGHIKVINGTGAIAAKTGGGNIELTGLSGTVDAKTSGGNISATITSADGPVSLSSSVGNIALSLPSSFPADLKARGTSIDLGNDFNFEGSKTNGTLSGTLNGGGIPITLNCGFGNVTINNEQ